MAEMTTEEQELEELIRFKQEQEKQNNKIQNARFDFLKQKYQNYRALNSDALKHTLQEEKTASCYHGNDSSIQMILQNYNAKFQNKDGSYALGYLPPTLASGSIELNFPSEASAIQFDREMAEKHLIFYVVDARTHMVLAYSNGDGHLYHSDGHEFQSHDTFGHPTVSAKDFTIPAPASSPKP